MQMLEKLERHEKEVEVARKAAELKEKEGKEKQDTEAWKRRDI